MVTLREVREQAPRIDRRGKRFVLKLMPDLVARKEVSEGVYLVIDIETGEYVVAEAGKESQAARDLSERTGHFCWLHEVTGNDIASVREDNRVG